MSFLLNPYEYAYVKKVLTDAKQLDAVRREHSSTNRTQKSENDHTFLVEVRESPLASRVSKAIQEALDSYRESDRRWKGELSIPVYLLAQHLLPRSLASIFAPDLQAAVEAMAKRVHEEAKLWDGQTDPVPLPAMHAKHVAGLKSVPQRYRVDVSMKGKDMTRVIGQLETWTAWETERDGQTLVPFPLPAYLVQSELGLRHLRTQLDQAGIAHALQMQRQSATSSTNSSAVSSVSASLQVAIKTYYYVHTFVQRLVAALRAEEWTDVNAYDPEVKGVVLEFAKRWSYPRLVRFVERVAAASTSRLASSSSSPSSVSSVVPAAPATATTTVLSTAQTAREGRMLNDVTSLLAPSLAKYVLQVPSRLVKRAQDLLTEARKQYRLDNAFDTRIVDVASFPDQTRKLLQSMIRAHWKEGEDYKLRDGTVVYVKEERARDRQTQMKRWTDLLQTLAKRRLRVYSREKGLGQPIGTSKARMPVETQYLHGFTMLSKDLFVLVRDKMREYNDELDAEYDKRKKARGYRSWGLPEDDPADSIPAPKADVLEVYRIRPAPFEQKVSVRKTEQATATDGGDGSTHTIELVKQFPLPVKYEEDVGDERDDAYDADGNVKPWSATDVVSMAFDATRQCLYVCFGKKIVRYVWNETAQTLTQEDLTFSDDWMQSPKDRIYHLCVDEARNHLWVNVEHRHPSSSTNDHRWYSAFYYMPPRPSAITGYESDNDKRVMIAASLDLSHVDPPKKRDDEKGKPSFVGLSFPSSLASILNEGRMTESRACVYLDAGRDQLVVVGVEPDDGTMTAVWYDPTNRQLIRRVQSEPEQKTEDSGLTYSRASTRCWMRGATSWSSWGLSRTMGR